jgi:pyruvate,orthophosphate dikinase
MNLTNFRVRHKRHSLGERCSGEEWFAGDCYRRFLQSYGMSFGLSRDTIDAKNNELKKNGVPYKKDFTPLQMKEVAMAYKEFIRGSGIGVEESPAEQLYVAIQRVLHSWNSAKAQTYRKIMGISDDWGTAVTIQSMVFGNLSQQSGAGVLFTHSPKFSPELLRPWGDYTIGNQGEDVVSGLVTTYPVSVYQAKMETASGTDLSKFLKFIRRSEIAKLLIIKHWGPQDMNSLLRPWKKIFISCRQTWRWEEKHSPSFGTSRCRRDFSATASREQRHCPVGWCSRP